MEARKSDLVDLMMQVHHRTDRAVLASETGDREKAVWLPLSHVEIGRVSAGQIAEITVPEWLALEKGLI